MKQILPPGGAHLARTSSDRLSTPAQHYLPSDAEQMPISLGHYAWLLRRAWWKIAAATVITTGLAGLAAHLLHPMYESTARVAVDPQIPNMVMGDRTPTNLAGSGADQFFNTELELIQSDAVLRPVAQKFGLLLKGKGGSAARDEADDAPVSLPGLSVVHPANSFLINITYRSHNPVQAAAIANAITRSFSERSHAIQAGTSREESDFIGAQLGDLKQKMETSAMALAAYEQRMGVINPEEKTSILQSRLDQLNTEYTQAQNDRIQKEVDLRALQTGQTEALEVSPQASELSKMSANVQAAQEKMATVKQTYGSASTDYKRAEGALNEATRQYKAAQGGVGKRIEMQFAKSKHMEDLLAITLRETKNQFDSLNAHSAEYQAVKREAESNKTLYAELFRKVQEARINAAFQGSPIRLFDQARPVPTPVFPKMSVFVGLGFLLSFLGSILAVVVADLMDKSLRDPSQARREMGIDVIGVLPFVRKFEALSIGAAHDHTLALPTVRGNQWFGSSEFYEEAVGALLTSIRLSRSRHALRSIVITSPSQGEGKSTCIAHMAAAHARQGHRTLLIDADLRCPSQHRLFDVKNERGLADIVSRKSGLKEACQHVPGIANLDIVVAGEVRRGMTERVGRTVEDLLGPAGEEYDLIFIDAPPMLCFAEPIHLASAADGVVVICRAGQTATQDTAEVLSTLQRLHAVPLGVVLNQVTPKISLQYGSYQTYYHRLSHVSAAA